MYYLKNKALYALIACALFLVTGCTHKNKKNKPSTSPATIIAEGASLHKITGNHQFNTAILRFIWMATSTNENFDDLAQSRTMRMDKNGEIDTLLSNNGTMPALVASGNGTVYACEMLGHKVVEMDTTGKVIRTVAGCYNGKRIDGPNGLVADAKGGIYFTDSQITATGVPKMQKTPAVYYIKPNGTVLRVIDDLIFPNGVALSPDGSILYVSDTKSKYVMAYDVSKGGALSNGRKFAEPEWPKNVNVSGADGMTVDSEGNLYVATTKSVQMFNKKGTRLATISCPSPTNNVTFGGVANKTLFNVSSR